MVSGQKVRRWGGEKIRMKERIVYGLRLAVREEMVHAKARRRKEIDILHFSFCPYGTT